MIFWKNYFPSNQTLPKIPPQLNWQTSRNGVTVKLLFSYFILVDTRGQVGNLTGKHEKVKEHNQPGGISDK